MDTSADLYSIAGEAIVIIRKRFLSHTDNNSCAAALLDEMYARSERSRLNAEYSLGRYEYDPSFLTTLPHLTEGLFGMFTQDEVIQALSLLIDKGYISIPDNPINGVYTIIIDQDEIDRVSDIYRGVVRRERQAYLASLPSPVPEPSPESQNAPAEIKSSREAKRVKYHLARAKKLALPASLTLDQWIDTLEYFNWKCAYCHQGEYEVFEHFMPLFQGGGTTFNNCVPSCTRCNIKKSDLHPDVFQEKMGDAIQHIQNYLKSLSGRAEE